MNDNVRKVFEMLGVKPYEYFHIGVTKNEELCVCADNYFINEHLVLLHVTKSGECFRAAFSLHGLLTGEFDIIKIDQPTKCKWTEDEKTLAKYWKMCGYNYIVRNKDGILMLFTSKPTKSCGMECWRWGDVFTRVYSFKDTIYAPNISWDNDEATALDDILKE